MSTYTGKLAFVLAGFLIISMSCRNEQSASERAAVAVEKQDGGFNLDAFADVLRSHMPAVDSTDSLYRRSGFRDPSTVLHQIYQRCEYQPLWVTGSGIADAAADAIDALDSLRMDGISPRRYRTDTLRNLLSRLRSESAPDDLLRFDTTLTLSWLKAASDLHFGLLKPRRADSLWFHANDTAWPAAQVLAVDWFANGEAPDLNRFRSQIPLYASLRARYADFLSLSDDPVYNDARMSLSPAADSLAKAQIRRLLPREALSGTADDSLLKAYQFAYGLPLNNRLDSTTLRSLQQSPDTLALKLAANMERLRWMPQRLEDRHLFVDIPLMELGLQDRGTESLRMRVVVGKPSRQTPSLGANMTNIVFSPSWSVPPTILKKDVLPGLSSRGAGYLARKGLKVYDFKGRPVAATSVNGANYKRFMYKQAPGARNALGEVKFNLPNDWDIYLHDTPHREDFVKRNRANSSGCIRVQDPKGLAAFILGDLEGKRYGPDRIDSIIATRKSRWVKLDAPIPVHIVYITAATDEKGLRLLPDIYRRDARLMRKLAEI